MSGFASSGRSRHPKPSGAGHRRRPSALDSAHISPVRRGAASRQALRTATCSPGARRRDEVSLNEVERIGQRITCVGHPLREEIRFRQADGRRAAGPRRRRAAQGWRQGVERSTAYANGAGICTGLLHQQFAATSKGAGWCVNFDKCTSRQRVSSTIPSEVSSPHSVVRR
jgi:hypothetical protein